MHDIYISEIDPYSVNGEKGKDSHITSSLDHEIHITISLAKAG